MGKRILSNFRRIESDDRQCSGQLEGLVCTLQLCCATVGVAWGHPCRRCPAELDCRPGFLKNAHTGRCMDINECEAVPGLCSAGRCVNTAGSFSCECPEGTAADGDHDCVDVDECEAGVGGGADACGPHGRCLNRDPGYVCVCDPGYIPSKSVPVYFWMKCNQFYE